MSGNAFSRFLILENLMIDTKISILGEIGKKLAEPLMSMMVAAILDFGCIPPYGHFFVGTSFFGDSKHICSQICLRFMFLSATGELLYN